MAASGMPACMLSMQDEAAVRLDNDQNNAPAVLIGTQRIGHVASNATVWPVVALVRAASRTRAVATASHASTGSGLPSRIAAATAG